MVAAKLEPTEQATARAAMSLLVFIWCGCWVGVVVGLILTADILLRTRLFPLIGISVASRFVAYVGCVDCEVKIVTGGGRCPFFLSVDAGRIWGFGGFVRAGLPWTM